MSLIENIDLRWDDFHLSVPRWEILDKGITSLVGPSGSGKSTLFRVLLGLIPCPGMSWTLEGLDLARLSVRDRRLGVVFQNYELFPHLTGRENILFAAKARKLSHGETKSFFDHLVENLKLETFIDRKAIICSGGEKQRIALARAVIGRPRVLLLDEPFTALDEDLRNESRLWVQSMISEFQIPTLLVTHDRRDVEVLANKVTKIANGKLTNA